MSYLNKLHDINRQFIYDKLDAVQCIERDNQIYVRCDDIFRILSKSIVRDKRLINDYSSDEVITMSIEVSSGQSKVIRLCRLFTQKGLHRYIQEGKIISYIHVCEYFNLSVKDSDIIKINSCLVDKDLFDTKKILKWVFGKRKQVKQLGATVNIKEFAEWLSSNQDNCLINRKNKVLKLAGIPANRISEKILRIYKTSDQQKNYSNSSNSDFDSSIDVESNIEANVKAESSIEAGVEIEAEYSIESNIEVDIKDECNIEIEE